MERRTFFFLVEFGRVLQRLVWRDFCFGFLWGKRGVYVVGVDVEVARDGVIISRLTFALLEQC